MNDDLTVFISYRRADSSADAGRLYDALRRRFGRENLFMDVDSLQPGEDWVVAVEAAVTRCDVLLAVIGPTWVGATDSEGGLRLDNELDRVRLEIEAALRNNKPVIPVLVEGASMPTADQLPDTLKPLLRRHAIRISHPTFESDLGALVRALRTIERARHPKPDAKEAAAAAAAAAPPVIAAAATPTPPTPPTPTYDAPPLPAVTSPPMAPPPVIPPPAYVAPVQPYVYTPPAYPAGQPQSSGRGGASPALLGLLGIGLVLVVGFVLLAVLHIGPFAVTAVATSTPAPTQPAFTPQPTLPATPTAAPTAPPTDAPTVPPTAVPTAPPTDTPTAEASRTPYPSAAFDPIWAIVPLDVVPNCQPTSNYDTPQLFCYVPASGLSLWYEAFPDVASLTAAYNGWLSYHAITPGVASCFDDVTPCEGPYKVGGIDPAGRVGGIVDNTDGWIYWTHEQAGILGTGLIPLDTGNSYSDLFSYWSNPGSVLNYTPSPSP